MPLYPYQERVKALILAGKSVILQTPTGSGKTRAALAPFIETFFDRNDHSAPRKCIYVVPMRVLASQFVVEYKDLAKSYQNHFHRDINVTIQTGQQPDDKEFTGDLIFCTVDQFVSSVLTMPYSLSGRKANLNAGACVGSYLVFDEFHLLDPESTLPTAWHTIKQFSRIAPVLLMTATFSSSMLASLAKGLDAEVVTVTAEEAYQIENREATPLPRQRTWFTAAQPLSPEAILKEHKRRSLVLCNTVQRAQTLYGMLKQLIEINHLDIQLLMLHSRFLPEDRARVEADLHRFFGREDNHNASGSIIAIATQTIEVGVNITSEVLHSELAPASALIQRAGRCARYPGEQGRVFIYPVENFAPYAMGDDGKAWKEEMQAAYQWLSIHSGQVFDLAKEQELVDAVATTRDRRVVAGLVAGSATRKQDIFRVLNGHAQSADGRLLVRDAISCRILIHPQPDDLLDHPYRVIGFNLQPSTLYGLLKSWQERANESGLDWVAKTLVNPPNDKGESNISDYRWASLDSSMIPGAKVVVVNPALAGYDPNEGFLPDRGHTPFVSVHSEDKTRASWEGHGYQLESYEEHIHRVLRAFTDVALPELYYPALALDKAAGWQSGTVLKAAWLACLFHDVGKLSTGWQKWAHAHQQAIGASVSNQLAVAHTDTRLTDDAMKIAAAKALRQNRKPNHAGEGAAAISAVLLAAVKQPEVARAAITAITRHHTPFATEFQDFTLVPLAAEHIAATLELLPADIQRRVNLTALQSNLLPDPTFATAILVQPAQVWPWLAYTLLVRALRRADSIGTSYGSE